jgi:hypothetical protein
MIDVRALAVKAASQAIMGTKAAISGPLHPEMPPPKTLGSLNTHER